MSEMESGASGPEQRCAWCGMTLEGQRWVSLVRPPKAEIHCCSEGCLVLAITIHRVMGLQ